MQKLRTKYTLSRGSNSKAPTPPPSIHSYQQEPSVNQPEQIKDNGIITNYSQHNNSNKSIHSHHSHENPFDSNLICQNCINQYLIDLKRNKVKDDYQFSPFEDKMKDQSQQAIQSKVKSREAQTALAGNALTDFNSQEKTKFIHQQENNSNPLNDPNYNYLYEKALAKQAAREKLINDNLDKYQLNERPEITAYYKHYVDKQPSNDVNNQIYKETENQRAKDIEQYRNDLLKQIEYKNELKRKEMEEDARRERDNYDKVVKNVQRENEERYLHDKARIEEVRDYNLELIRQKNLRKMKEKEEDELYNERFRKDIEDAKRKEEEREREERVKKEMLLKENLNHIENERNKRLKARKDDNNYEYKDKLCCSDQEDMGKCMNCKRVFPRRLLTINRNFYTNSRK